MPKKKWGQNFLRNQGAVEKIVAAVEPKADEIVVEIGPGQGALTDKLVEKTRHLTVIEIDPDLVSALQAKYGGRIMIVHGDAVEVPLPDRVFRAVGNLPYNAGTPILRRVIADPHCRRAVFMLQKEVADRLTAKPGDDAYGYLTLYTHLFATAKQILTLDPRSFYPPPKVRSAVVVLDPRLPSIRSDRGLLIELISTAFRMRRKTLVNNLSGWNGSREEWSERLNAASLSPTIRAEAMSLEDFDRLLQELKIEN